jgi:exo-beta-1,3-glucanase (GH17 family)
MLRLMSILILASCFIISCNTENEKLHMKDENSIASKDSLIKNLKSSKSYERESPFSVRSFSPFFNGKWIGNAVSYGCYRKGQAPGKSGPSKEQILEDLNIISQYWNLIRVYNTDIDTENILKVIEENKIPIKMMLGVWLEHETDSEEKKEQNIKNAIRAIELANQYGSIIVAINVGNETQVFWSAHKMDTDDLTRYIRAVRKNVNCPVTVADDYNFWNKDEAAAIANEVDFITTHIYPLWNGKKLDESIEWTDSVFKYIQAKYPDQQIVLGEIGWATDYNQDKKGPGEQGTLIKGKVSIKAQEEFLIKLNNWINTNENVTFLFEVFDEPWKGGGSSTGDNEIEKNWGVFYENRQPKQSFVNYLKQIN